MSVRHGLEPHYFVTIVSEWSFCRIQCNYLDGVSLRIEKNNICINAMKLSDKPQPVQDQYIK